VLWEAQFWGFRQCRTGNHRPIHCQRRNQVATIERIVCCCRTGFEGMGPEHSSARLERFLSLQRRQPANRQSKHPAQYFHSIAKTVLQRWRNIVVMTPESLLRIPNGINFWRISAGRQFQARPCRPGRHAPERVLLCSENLFRVGRGTRQLKRDEVAIIRLEQLYHFPGCPGVGAGIIRGCTPLTWVQEEPEIWEPGATCRRGLESIANRCVSRPESASPATGSAARHKQEQRSCIPAFGRRLN